MASTRTRWVYILLVLLTCLVHANSLPKNHSKVSKRQSRQFPNFIETTAKNGYSTEQYSVVTQDGYILKIFRIAQSKNCHQRKFLPPVLMMHGLLESSDSWTDAGVNAGLAYLLSDACFDSWLGNFRGNYYSRRHKTLDPNKDKPFWKFSADEMGLYDVPALVDYVLNKTGVEKLNYIGYSQGAGTFFAMCSDRPGHCEKINLMIGLAPATRHLHTRSLGFRVASMAFTVLEKTLRSVGIEEVLQKGSLVQTILAAFCQWNSISEVFCDVGTAFLDFYHPGSMTNETLARATRNLPAGTSVQNLAKYGQSMVSTDFQKFDYGRETNLKVYGQERPPKYKLGAVTPPVVVIYGKNDGLVDVKDVKWLIGKLPNVIDVLEVKDPLWNHLDNHYSKLSKNLIFPKIHEQLLAHSYY
ncbi:unnamed protein product [Chilo suppressalis]|uniref:Lipase n=1 Tax=Chilo suppressalis TaxID=168631 RepID=A0ABN8L8T6_CHISP|nr:unnamed protein product [Chilo suppressalis]